MTPELLVAMAAGVLGLAIGSFLNVVVYRIPAGESLLRPASHCPSCGAGVRARHNVPVLGWLVLRGRCADCHAPISARYPLVEAGTAALFATVALRVLRLHQPGALPAYLYLAAAGIALALIDVDHLRLPDRIVLPSYGVLAALLSTASLFSGHWWPLARAALGMVVLLAGYFAAFVAYPAGLGFGDVKLAGVLGAALGYLSWSALAVGAFAGFALGALYSLALMAIGRAGRKSAVPFGPFMLAGAFVGVFFGTDLAQAYVRLMS